MMNKSVSVKTLFKVGIIVLGFIMLVIGFKLYVGLIVNATHTGYEEKVLSGWQESSKTEYILDENCYVSITDITYDRDENNNLVLEVSYNVFNKYGKRIVSGYNPDIQY